MNKQKEKNQYSLQLAVAAATLGMSMGVSPSVVLASPNTGVEQEPLQVSAPKMQQPGTVYDKHAQPEMEYGKLEKPEMEYGKLEKPEMEYGKLEKPEMEYGKLEKPEMEYGKLEKPEMEYGKLEKPEMEYGKLEKPRVDQPGVQYRKLEQPGTEYHKIDKPGVQFPKTEIIDVTSKVGDVSSDNVPPTPIPPNLGRINLNGTWNYKTNDGKAGTVEITQKGKDVTLVVTSGAKCKPIAVCSYTGTLDGNVATVSNSVIVDKAGGKVTSDMVLNISIEKSTILGSSTHDYVHPSGHKMHWNLVYEMIREAKSSIGTLEQMGDDPWVK